MAEKAPKEVKIDNLEYNPDILPVDVFNHQDEFLYGKSIERLDNKWVAWLSVVATTGAYSDLIWWPAVKKYCFATKSAAQSIATASGTTLTLNTYETNDSGMSVTADRITITAAGQYLVTSAVQYTSNSTGSREAFIRVNGSTIFADNIVTPPASDLCSVVFATFKTFAVNDYIEFRAFQNSGWALNVNSGIANTFLSVHQL